MCVLNKLSKKRKYMYIFFFFWGGGGARSFVFPLFDKYIEYFVPRNNY